MNSFVGGPLRLVDQQSSFSPIANQPDALATILGAVRRFTISPFGLRTVPSPESAASYTLKRPDQNSRRYRYTLA
jgi:hypothetical protein